MSAPQIYALQTTGLLPTVENGVLIALNQYSTQENPLCSHNILGVLDLQTIRALTDCAKCDAGGYSMLAGWVGAVAAELERSGMISKTNRSCHFNSKSDPAWYV